MNTAIIDGDVLVYAAAFACQKKEITSFSEDGQVLAQFSNKNEYNAWVKEQPEGLMHEAEVREWTEPEALAEQIVDTLIERIVRGAECDDRRVYLSPSLCFRNDLYPAYKANRKDKPKPDHYEFVKAHLVKAHGAKAIEGLEADDVLGINGQRKGGVIATIDKDLQGVPGIHFNWNKDDRPRRITPKQAKAFLNQQLLTGDSTDSIPGISRCGPKTAQKLLADLTEPAQARVIADKYKDQYDEAWKEQLTLVGNLVYILRKGPDERFDPQEYFV